VRDLHALQRETLGVGQSPSLRLWRSTARCIVAAPASASAAPEYDTMSASPIVFTSVPPVAATASRSDAKWSRRNSSAAASPISDASSVEPTRSVNRIVIRPRAMMSPQASSVSRTAGRSRRRSIRRDP